MADFLGLMKQAAELKSKMEAMQAELETSEVEGVPGGGVVAIKLNGKGDLKAVSIDESLIKPGASVFVGAQKGADGKYVALFVLVGKDGVVPAL